MGHSAHCHPCRNAQGQIDNLVIGEGGMKPRPIGLVVRKSTRILGDALAMLKRQPLKCHVAFIGGTHSREMRLVGTELTDKVSKGRVMWLDGSHLFPMEKPIATAAAVEAALRNMGAH